MSPARPIHPTTRAERADGDAAAVLAIAEAATSADGVAPFNEDSLLSLDERSLVLVSLSDPNADADPDEDAAAGDPAGAALARPVDGGAGLEAELAVHPGHRLNGAGRALVDALLAQAREAGASRLTLWAHGALPGAIALAASAGLERVRTLLRLELALGPDAAPAPAEPVAPPAGILVADFDPAADAAEFLRLNARVFRHHPEQGALDERGLRARMEQPWFRADRFVVARDADSGAMLGYNWLKSEQETGEIYVVGVADEAAGRGIGRALMVEGLRRLRQDRPERIELYVEGDNDRAVGLYRSLGFVDAAVDVQFARDVDAV